MGIIEAVSIIEGRVKYSKDSNFELAWSTIYKELAEALNPSHNSAMVPCKSWQDCRRNQFCPIGVQCGTSPCMIAHHQ